MGIATFLILKFIQSVTFLIWLLLIPIRLVLLVIVKLLTATLKRLKKRYSILIAEIKKLDKQLLDLNSTRNTLELSKSDLQSINEYEQRIKRSKRALHANLAKALSLKLVIKVSLLVLRLTKALFSLIGKLLLTTAGLTGIFTTTMLIGAIAVAAIFIPNNMAQVAKTANEAGYQTSAQAASTSSSKTLKGDAKKYQAVIDAFPNEGYKVIATNMLNEGYSVQAVAGVLANVEHESHANFNEHHKVTESGSYNEVCCMFQFTSRYGSNSGLYYNYIAYAKTRGKAWNDAQTQYDFVFNPTAPSYLKTYINNPNRGQPKSYYTFDGAISIPEEIYSSFDEFKDADNARRAAFTFMTKYEVCFAGSSVQNSTAVGRMNAADKWFNLFKAAN